MSEAASVFSDGAAYERQMGRWSKLVGRDFLEWMAPAVEARHIRIETVFSDFEDYWESNTVLSGPQAPMIARMTSEKREQLRDAVRNQLSSDPDGRITVPAVASSVKGRVPG